VSAYCTDCKLKLHRAKCISHGSYMIVMPVKLQLKELLETLLYIQL